VVGFVAIAFSQTKALRDFALLGALGLTGAFLTSVLVLPALLVLVDRSAGSASAGSRLPVRGMLRLLSHYPSAFLAGALVLFVAAGATLLIPGTILPLESDLTVMHPRPNPPLDAQKRIADVMGASPDTFVVYLHANSAESLQRVAHEVEHRLSQPKSRAPGVSGTFGLASLLPDPDVAQARIDATGPKYADRVIADFRAAVADSIFDPTAFEPYEGFLRTLLTSTNPPTIADLARYPSLADNILPASAFERGAPLPTEAITLVFLRQGDDTREARDKAVTAIRSALSGLDGATLTGLSVLGHDVELSIRRELPRLVLAAVIVAALYLVIHFRNARDCVLAMLPSVFSLICLLAFMRLSGAKLNMVNLAAFPLLVGIDVDYGIFLVSAARSRRVGTMERAELFVGLEPASGAVLMCAASTLLGFGSLAFTSIPAVRSLGQTVAIGVIGCVIGTFCLALPLIVLRRPEMMSETQ
jgi:predicted RND superfamily exporter protein